MASSLHLYKTLDRKYRTERDNPKEYVATVKVHDSKTVALGNDYDDCGTTVYRLIAPNTMRGTDLSQAIRDTMRTGGCSHDYDCCGCASSYASEVRRISQREYNVVVRTTRNY